MGLFPAIDNTIQFSELPAVQVCISGAADESGQSISSEWPLVPATLSPWKKLYQWPHPLFQTQSHTRVKEWSWKTDSGVYISLMVPDGTSSSLGSIRKLDLQSTEKTQQQNIEIDAFGSLFTTYLNLSCDIHTYVSIWEILW